MQNEDDRIARGPMTWEALNAYVDDELAPEAAADVAAAVARDPDLAARVASLSRLRATMRGLSPEAGPPTLRLQARKRRLSARVAALAGSLVGAAGLGAAIWAFAQKTPDVRPLSAAIAAHRTWLSDTRPNRGGRVDVDMAGNSASALPDLSLASLTLVHLSLDPAIQQGGGVLAGYVGPNGCRIGLWIAPNQGAVQPHPVAEDRDGLMIRRWSGTEAEYALLGRDVDSLRLDRIAALVARLTRIDAVVPSDQIAALDEARGVGPACMG